MNGGLSPEERRRLRWCRWVALLAPVVAASASFAVLRTAWLVGGPRMRTTPGYQTFWSIFEYGVFPGNALLGAVAAMVAVLFLHPVPGRRWRAAVGWMVASPVIYVAAYVLWEQVWDVVR